MHHLRRVVILAMLLAASLVPLAAQDAGEWYLDKPIADVVFTGLVNVKVEDLAAVVKPYLSEPFTYELFERLQNAIVALDWFERLEPIARDPDGTAARVTVEFQVTERPAVSVVQVAGNAQVRSADILEKVLLKAGDLVSDSKRRSDEEAIRLLYLDKGYADVTVGSRMEPTEEPGSVKVVFTVVEGAQTKIKQVRFSGNVWASESTLRSKMDTKPPSLFDAGVFQAATLEADKQKIADYYADHGFLDARVERVEKAAEGVDGGKNELLITVYVVEGDQYTYTGMSFEGNKVFPTEQLTALVSQRPGKAVVRQKVLDDFRRVEELYTDNGYIFNKIDREEVRDETVKSVAYVVHIQEFDKAHIEKIVFKGNAKTAEGVLRRELPLAEGDVFNRAKIVEGLRALYNLQYFSNVTLDTPTGSAPGLIDLVFTVEESSTADINFGVMFSGGDFPISGTVKWNERNFRGQGQTFGVNVELSPVKQMASLNFFEPWMLGVRWSMGASLSVDHSTQTGVLQDLLSPVFPDGATEPAPDPYATQAEYLAALAAGDTIPDQYLMSYDSFEISLAFNTGYRKQTDAGLLGVRGSLSSRLRYVNYDPLLYRPYEESVRDNLKLFRVIDRFSPTIYLDGRDYYLNPSNGWYLSQGIGYTGGLLFGSRHYIRTDTTAEGFLKLFSLPVFEGWDWSIVLAAHSGLSMILPQYYYDPEKAPGERWGWDTVTDSTDLLYIDGMTVGRGWRQMNGGALWDNKLELRTPLAKDVLTGVLFFDAAALWPAYTDVGAMTIQDFRFSFGAGLRFTIPQFPIRLYLGKAFQVDDTGKVVWKDGDLALGDNLSLSFIISLGGDVF